MAGTFKKWLDTAATLGLLLAAVIVSYVAIRQRTDVSNAAAVDGRREPSLPTDPVALEGVALKGQPGARFAMLVFSDFECPFCKKFAEETLASVDRAYVETGKLLVSFRHLPLSRHRYAKGAAVAAQCAGLQGRFWQMHDRLFASQTELAIPNLIFRAQQLGLRLPEFQACLDGTEQLVAVESDMAFARKLGVSSTPVALIGVVGRDGTLSARRWVMGAKPFETVRSTLEQIFRESLR